MHIFRDIRDVRELSPNGSAIALGIFDGVHAGPQALLNRAVELAKAEDLTSIALTFAPHPAKVLAPKYAPLMLEPLGARLERFEALGLDAVIVHPFDHTFAATAPKEFVRSTLGSALRARHIIVGEGFVFGAKQAGNVPLLKELESACGYQTHAVGHVRLEGIQVSSTKIREFVQNGHVDAAQLLLTRPYEIIGECVQGAGRGKGLGFGTANLRCTNEQLPSTGVYACFAEVSGQRWDAVVNIGYNPTFGASGLKVEAHLLDFTGQELYGQQVRLAMIGRIRSEVRFESPDELKKQIAMDVEQAKAMLEAAREDRAD